MNIPGGAAAAAELELLDDELAADALPLNDSTRRPQPGPELPKFSARARARLAASPAAAI